ncbi:MAG: ABC transporter ATP-binding protein [bacterium]|jgi:lipoprotein-releasing system ATP-binding protein
MTERAVLLQCRELNKTYQSGEEKLVVLDGLNLALPENEFLAITGESGSGKSTLLHLLGCLDKPTSGEIFFRDTAYSTLSQHEQDRLRNREFGFVFQFHHLLPEFNALENVALPGLMAGTPSSELWRRAEELLHDLNLHGRLHHKPNQLSGGEQQRVAVARAMINSPSILFMDEPTGNLDPRHSEELVQLIRQQQKEKHLTVVVVTHNQEIAEQADRHLVLAGKLLEPAAMVPVE